MSGYYEPGETDVLNLDLNTVIESLLSTVLASEFQTSRAQ